MKITNHQAATVVDIANINDELRTWTPDNKYPRTTYQAAREALINELPLELRQAAPTTALPDEAQQWVLQQAITR